MTDTTNPSIRAQAEALLDRLRSGDGEEAFDVNGFVHSLLSRCHKVAAIWCIEDMKAIRPDLTDDQAWEALEEVGRKHDAEYGISWTTLECMADILFGHAPETHDVEEKQP